MSYAVLLFTLSFLEEVQRVAIELMGSSQRYINIGLNREIDRVIMCSSHAGVLAGPARSAYVTLVHKAQNNSPYLLHGFWIVQNGLDELLA